MAAALVLAILEIISPAYIFLGFAIGALCVGGLMFFGALTTLSLPLVLLVFAVISLLAWLALRLVFGVRLEKVKTWSKEYDIND